MSRCLLTGIGGFIGSHFLAHFLINTDWEIVGIDSWSNKGISERITESVHYQKHKDRCRIYTHDLSAPFSEILKHRIGEVDYIVNLASESHVDRSITEPRPFIQNNVNLAINTLEYAREVKPRAFIQIGTDESYGPAYGDDRHKEWAEILPSNPYSASKACQEAIAVSYWRTYGVPLILTNTMNNFAEMQDSEKFIPLVIKKLLAGEEVEIHADKDGTPGSRFWIHARNHADAILYLLKNDFVEKYPTHTKPQRFNVVGDREINNLEMAEFIAETLNKELKYKLKDAHSTRPGHDLRYALDGYKLKLSGWRPPVTFTESLKKTINWYLENREWL